MASVFNFVEALRLKIFISLSFNYFVYFLPVVSNIYKDTMDDPFISCPYDHKHRVPRSRIQAHIVRCEQNHPGLAICPYNATHRLPKADIKIHVQSCSSKEAIFPENKPPKVIAHLSVPKPILQREYLPETDPNHEIWDD